jgi:hypothetical protein
LRKGGSMGAYAGRVYGVLVPCAYSVIIFAALDEQLTGLHLG